MSLELNCKKADIFGPEATNRSLWHLFADVALQFPDKEAVVSYWQHSRWTYADLMERIEKLACWLAERGCSKGDYFIAVFDNCAEWAISFWAAVRLGMIFVPLSPKYPALRKQIESLPRRDKSVLVVLSEISAAAIEDALQPDMMSGFLGLCCSPSLNRAVRLKSTWHYLSEIISVPFNPDLSLPSTDSISGDDYVLVLFTSGTFSGMPKACPHTCSNIWLQTCVRLSNEVEDRTLIALPLFHIFGFNQALRTMRFGGRIVLPSQEVDVATILSVIKEEKCTHIPVAKAMIEAIIQGAPPSTKLDISSLRLVELGVDSVSSADLERYKAKLGTTVVQSYGMTEGSPIATWPTATWSGGTAPAAAGVGRVTPGAKIKICHPDDPSAVLGRNEPGMLHISGPSVISGYLVAPPDQTDNGFYVDGGSLWFITGDRVRIDENDCLHILGRYEDLITRGGESIASVEVENWIRDKFNIVVSSATLLFLIKKKNGVFFFLYFACIMANIYDIVRGCRYTR